MGRQGEQGQVALRLPVVTGMGSIVCTVRPDLVHPRAAY